MGEHGGRESHEPIKSVKELHEAMRRASEERASGVPASEMDEDEASEPSDPNRPADPDIEAIREAYRKAREENPAADEDADSTQS
jgi:hypothetical protein